MRRGRFERAQMYGREAEPGEFDVKHCAAHARSLFIGAREGRLDWAILKDYLGFTLILAIMPASSWSSTWQWKTNVPAISGSRKSMRRVTVG
jgi:hypothetical protein